jgi:hypothetical protein
VDADAHADAHVERHAHSDADGHAHGDTDRHADVDPDGDVFIQPERNAYGDFKRNPKRYAQRFGHTHGEFQRHPVRHGFGHAQRQRYALGQRQPFIHPHTCSGRHQRRGVGQWSRHLCLHRDGRSGQYRLGFGQWRQRGRTGRRSA